LKENIKLQSYIGKTPWLINWWAKALVTFYNIYIHELKLVAIQKLVVNQKLTAIQKLVAIQKLPANQKLVAIQKLTAIQS